MLSVNQSSADHPNEPAMTRHKQIAWACSFWRRSRRFIDCRLINKKMAKSLFNQVLLEMDFVLEQSNGIKNQILVSYVNLIYNLIVEARNSNFLDEVLFLIASTYTKCIGKGNH